MNSTSSRGSKLEGYFLVVDDIMRFCREHGILAQGRGSAANSAVCYSLGITAVDPVGMELLFERFLSEERGEWPDIDIDLPSGELRERVIQYVYDRYNRQAQASGPGAGWGAAMTANVITWRGRGAAREVGKALGFPEDLTARLSQLLGSLQGHPDEREAGAAAPEGTGELRVPPPAARIARPVEEALRQAGLDPSHPQLLHFLRLCHALQDLPRHLGQHSGGMIVCAGQLDRIVPLEKASMPGRVVVQWDKEDCADLGIIKVDLLGLGMMAVLQDALLLTRDRLPRAADLSPVAYGSRLASPPPSKSADSGSAPHAAANRAALPPSTSTGFLPKTPTSTACCSKPTPSACFRWKAAPRWRRCRACVPSAFTTWWSRSR